MIESLRWRPGGIGGTASGTGIPPSRRESIFLFVKTWKDTETQDSHLVVRNPRQVGKPVQVKPVS